MADRSKLRAALARASRARWSYAAVVVVAVAGSVAMLRSPRPASVTVVAVPAGPPVCAALPAALEGVWNPAARRALLANNPQATTSTAWLADVIDHHTSAWPALRRAACASNLGDPAWSPALLEAAAGCLAARRAELDRALALHQRAADDLVAAALALQDPRGCVDLRQIAEASVRRAELADIVGVIELTAGALDADRDGDARRAAQLSDAALVAASRLGRPRARALALATLGQIELRQGARAAARDHLAAAHAAYRGLGEPLQRFRTALAVTQLLVGDGALDDAERWLGRAAAEAERPGATADQRVEVALAGARLLAARPQLAAALAALDRVLPAIRDEPDPRYLIDYTRALGEKARLQLLDGRPAEALATARSALIVQERIYGKDHPALLSLLRAIGLAERELGRLDEALATLERARQIAIAHLPPGAQPRVAALTDYGVTLGRRDVAAGLTVLEAASGEARDEAGRELGDALATLRSAARRDGAPPAR